MTLPQVAFGDDFARADLGGRALCTFELQIGYPATSRTRGRGNKAELEIAQFRQLSNDTAGCIFRRVSVPV